MAPYNFQWVDGLENSAGCEITEIMTIYTEEGPTVQFTALSSEMALPENDLITFNNSVNATDYQWKIQGTNFDYTSSELDLTLALPFADANYEVGLIPQIKQLVRTRCAGL